MYTFIYNLYTCTGIKMRRYRQQSTLQNLLLLKTAPYNPIFAFNYISYMGAAVAVAARALWVGLSDLPSIALSPVNHYLVRFTLLPPDPPTPRRGTYPLAVIEN